MDNNQKITVVELTFKRIQQFLFAVPRLKAMIGANALLGEVIRNELTKSVSNHKPYSITEVEAPPKKDDDPIEDDPASLYQKGVISRDGGHFTAVFKTQDDANSFITKARSIIATELPGIQIESRLKIQGQKGSTDNTHTYEKYGHSPVLLPQFLVCEDTGNDVASTLQGDDKSPKSNIVKRLEKAGGKFKKGKIKDIIGLLVKNKKLPHLVQEKQNKKTNIPNDLSDLAGSKGYIAVIHIDGNSIGSRRKGYVGDPPDQQGIFDFKEYIKHEVENEKFFHSMRTAMRISVVEALKQTFNKDNYSVLPYHLLMLGGDDLLLITRPEYAFPFTIKLANQLKKYPLPEDGSAVGIGAGIIIAHHNVPFYHLHHLAENLASSAKKLFRQQGKKDISVIDWMVSSNSWIDNIDETRRLYDLSDDGKYCLSSKPYFILDEATKDYEQLISLEQLQKTAEAIHKALEDNNNKTDDEKLARSQLKNLLQPISDFKTDESREHFQRISNLPKAFTDLFGDTGEQLWKEIDNNHLTHYKDLLELVELHYLGRSQSTDNNQQEQGVNHE